MKIYNTKSFVASLFFFFLTLVNLWTAVHNGFTAKSLVLLVLTFLLGLGALAGSLSKLQTREDKISDMDERNRFLKVKVQSKTLLAIQLISFLLTAFFAVLGSIHNVALITGISVGTGSIFAFSVIIELAYSVYLQYRS